MATLAEQIEREVRADTDLRLEVVRRHVEYLTQTDAPHVSGDLRRSITVEPFRASGTRYTTTVRATAPQAAWTNEGTGEYVGNGRIYPTRAPALVFYWRKVGHVVAFRSVAGQPGQHWWDGPSGGAEDRRYDEGLAAAFGL